MAEDYQPNGDEPQAKRPSLTLNMAPGFELCGETSTEDPIHTEGQSELRHMTESQKSADQPEKGVQVHKVVEIAGWDKCGIEGQDEADSVKTYYSLGEYRAEVRCVT